MAWPARPGATARHTLDKRDVRFLIPNERVRVLVSSVAVCLQAVTPPLGSPWARRRAWPKLIANVKPERALVQCDLLR